MYLVLTVQLHMRRHGRRGKSLSAAKDYLNALQTMKRKFFNLGISVPAADMAVEDLIDLIAEQRGQEDEQ